MTGGVRIRDRRCSRCGGLHLVRGHPLVGSPVRCELACGAVREMTHYYLCPVTKQPVLVSVADVPAYSDPMREGAD